MVKGIELDGELWLAGSTSAGAAQRGWRQESENIKKLHLYKQINPLNELDLRKNTEIFATSYATWGRTFALAGICKVIKAANNWEQWNQTSHPSAWPGICVFVLSGQTALREGQLIFVSFIVPMVGKSSTAIVRQVDTKAAGVRQPIGHRRIAVELCYKENRKKAQRRPALCRLLSKDIVKKKKKMAEDWTVNVLKNNN